MLDKIKNIKPSKTVRRMVQGFLLLGLAVLTLTAVTFKQKEVVKGLKIELNDKLNQQHLIDKTYLKSILIKEYGSDLKDVPVEFIDLQEVETFFNDNPYVKRSEVFINKKGILEVQVQERQPLVRVMDSEKSFYLDEEGVSMPLANQYAARLPIVFLPEASDKYLTIRKKNNLLTLVSEINKNDFVKALTDQIEINAKGEFTIIPLLGNEKIKFGTTVDVVDKLERITLFYKEKVGRGHWSQCTYIDVRFKGQIVCDTNKT